MGKIQEKVIIPNKNQSRRRILRKVLHNKKKLKSTQVLSNILTNSKIPNKSISELPNGQTTKDLNNKLSINELTIKSNIKVLSMNSSKDILRNLKSIINDNSPQSSKFKSTTQSEHFKILKSENKTKNILEVPQTSNFRGA